MNIHNSWNSGPGGRLRKEILYSKWTGGQRLVSTNKQNQSMHLIYLLQKISPQGLQVLKFTMGNPVRPWNSNGTHQFYDIFKHGMLGP